MLKVASHREPLLLNASLIGSVAPGILSELRPEFSLGITLTSLDSQWHLSGPADLALAQLARALQAAGHCPHWRDELLGVYASQGQMLGAIERGATRILGIHTQAVHLVGYSENGIWLQQRAMTKSDDPGKWDTLSGGMVSRNESFEQALERETLEEAGLNASELHELFYQGSFDISEATVGGQGWRQETLHWYSARLSSKHKPRNLDGEVLQFQCIERDILQEWIAAGKLSSDASRIFQAALDRRLI
ncbi:MAG: NUDIX domain-containing protein [Burkholderiales bacterium]|nr:MAG: NUDIX domain-containing protein [Burkholderiales bacterium]